MEGRNFHTALIGGFRKKDVISYLAEEKRLQEEQVEELRRNQVELEQQLDEARTDSGANRLLNEGLQGEVEVLRQQLELTRMDLNTAKEAQLLAESRLTQAEARLAMAEEDRLTLEGRLAAVGQENQALNAENDQLREAVTKLLDRPDPAAVVETLRAELEAQKTRNGELEAKLAQARINETYGLKMPADCREGDSLRADLAAERQRVAQLENQLRQMAARKEETGNADQLWALCGKMERTIRQMEQMLDGPYHVTCYPAEPLRDEMASAFGEPVDITAEPAERAAKSRATVSSLLQRVRGK